MSTSLNDVVFEVCREFYNQPARPSRLKRLRKKPLLFFEWIRKYSTCLFDEYGRLFLKSRKHLLDNISKLNVFVPTDKKFPDTKIAVYTVITGGYDDLKEPIYVDDSIDYYAFTDSTSLITQKGGGAWNIIQIPSYLDNLDNSRKNRYLKINHDEALGLTGKNYDYCIYIDGSCRITCDIKPLVYSLINSKKTIAIHDHVSINSPYREAASCYVYKNVDYNLIKKQMNFYKQEGMPESVHYFENTVLIRKMGDKELENIMRQWWEQLKAFTHRDQLSLPYVLWKNNKDSSYIFSLGNNVWKNPYFIFSSHNKGENKN